MRCHDLHLRVLVLIALLLPAPLQAADRVGPTRLGLPGLDRTLLVPSGSGPPVRMGIFYDLGSFDPSHGIDVFFGQAKIRSQSVRAHLFMRASRRALVSVSLPLRFVSVDGGQSTTGLGDLDVGLALRMFSRPHLDVGAWGKLRVPVGDDSKGLSTGEVEGEYGLLTTLRFFEDSELPELRWHFNVGLRINKSERDGYGAVEGDPREVGIFFPVYPGVGASGAQRDNDEILLRTAFEFRRRWGHIFLEAASDWLAFYDDASFQESATWLTPGIYAGKEDGVGLKLAWSLGLFADDEKTAYVPRLPDWMLSAGISLPFFLGGRDRDEDGIADKDDECPQQPEDIDGYQDDDGCPDDDNDGDGIPDRRDLAPNLPEDFDGFEDTDGRPELDNDLDGIPDDVDQCPNRPEDFDGFEDEDGCPDVVYDADGDGIEDAADLCPNQAEDRDGYEDDDGCPDPDNDLDGIPDDVDQCPLQREDYDGDRDDDGCPDYSEAEGASGG